MNFCLLMPSKVVGDGQSALPAKEFILGKKKKNDG